MSLPLPDRIGKYVITHLIGKGSTGFVYAAFDTEATRPVALKFLRTEFVSDPKMRERFYREAKALAAITHPNVVTILGTGSWMQYPFFAMELLSGNSLEKSIGARRFTEREAAQAACQILNGLSAVHAAGYVHRDVKPSNVHLVAEERLVLTDFSIVLDLNEAEFDPAENAVGTPGYMAPEQEAGEKVDARADLYAVGAMLFEMLTGSLPPAGDRSRQASKIEVPASCSPPLAQILRRSLANRPDDRFRDADEMQRALLPIADPPPETYEVPAPVPLNTNPHRMAQKGKTKAYPRRSFAPVHLALVAAGTLACLLVVSIASSGGQPTVSQPPKPDGPVRKATPTPKTYSLLAARPALAFSQGYATVRSGSQPVRLSTRIADRYQTGSDRGRITRVFSDPQGSPEKTVTRTILTDIEGRPVPGVWTAPWDYLSYWPPTEPVQEEEGWKFDQAKDPALKRPEVRFSFRLLKPETHAQFGDVLRVAYHVEQVAPRAIGTGFFLLDPEDFTPVYGRVTLRYPQRKSGAQDDLEIRRTEAPPVRETPPPVVPTQPDQPSPSRNRKGTKSPYDGRSVREPDKPRSIESIANEIHRVQRRMGETIPGQDDEKVANLKARLRNLKRQRDRLQRPKTRRRSRL